MLNLKAYTAKIDNAFKLVKLFVEVSVQSIAILYGRKIRIHP